MTATAVQSGVDVRGTIIQLEKLGHDTSLAMGQEMTFNLKPEINGLPKQVEHVGVREWSIFLHA